MHFKASLADSEMEEKSYCSVGNKAESSSLESNQSVHNIYIAS